MFRSYSYVHCIPAVEICALLTSATIYPDLCCMGVPSKHKGPASLASPPHSFFCPPMKPGTKKIAIAAGVVVALAVIGSIFSSTLFLSFADLRSLGTVVGVVVTETKKNSNSNSSSSSNSDTHSSGTNHGTSTTGSHAPAPSASTFPPDPALHKSFYGSVIHQISFIIITYF